MSQESSQYDFGELRVLVVDDQDDIRRGLCQLIGSLGCHVEMNASAEEALISLRKKEFDLVFTDLKMDGMSGDILLQKIKKQWPDIEVVLITGHGTIELAVSCLHNGASHFITKPFDNQEILTYVKRVGYETFTRHQTQANLARYQSHSIIAVDPRMQEILGIVEQIAPSTLPALIEGASGTGKELVAHEIHNRSTIRDKQFLAINCIALPDSLLESELFGYKKGAFTGAHKNTKGLFEQADGGTIFLDEVASMSLPFQGKLLRVLQEKVIRPLGGNADVPVDFRLIASSNRNLEEMVNRQEFREDLFYRLKVVTLKLPTLNERPECIPALAEYFLNRAQQELMEEQHISPGFTPATMDMLIEHEWKGNVRELENTINRAVIMCTGDEILPSHLGFLDDSVLVPVFTAKTTTYEEEKQKTIEAFQRRFIQTTLQRTHGNISKAAELAGLTRAAYQRIMRKLDITREATETK
ncbi:MAG: sigma-54-dependent Fis family transcriptional regulator [Candidatus Latescibacteria bacterium]|jgi:DNA-binding NtrC family response regulator|nr:sigma-54-dependent Fis family transcriptional regulator [Candidatus Latescibacterota bacterium]MBT4138050.1 sigma-54-dependent Fis family transcriptional regulator [Candidatus Latescibacterota bacterium]